MKKKLGTEGSMSGFSNINFDYFRIWISDLQVKNHENINKSYVRGKNNEKRKQNKLYGK